MLPRREQKTRIIQENSQITKRAPIPGKTALVLIIVVMLIGIAVQAATADNATSTTTQTTVPTSTQTTVTTVETTVASSTQTAAVPWFNAAPLSGAAPLSVQFTDASTVTPTAWEWFFGDGTSGYVQNPSHTYSDPGTYSVSMKVVMNGMTYTATRTDLITVTAAQTTATTTTTSTTTATTKSGSSSTVEAAFYGLPRAGTAPFKVTFADTSTGSPTSWDWDFGDGGSSTLENPTHTYDEPGSYSVTLTVSDGDDSDELTYSNYILVVTPTTPVTTMTTAPRSATSTTRVPTTQAGLSTVSTTSVPSGGGIDLGGFFMYIIAVVVIVVIAGIIVVIYRRRNRYDPLR